MRATLPVLAVLAVALAGCAEPCATDADCALPAVCSADRRCVAPAPADDGAACTHDLHCRGGACLFSGAAGTCATACQSAADCAQGRCALAQDARAEGARLRFACAPPAGDRYAAETCSDDGQCRSGLCHDGHCTMPCGTCPASLACGPATLARGALSLDHGVCSWWPVLPVLELGGVDTADTGATALTFDVPATAGAFTLVLEDFANRVPAVTRLVAPDGAVFVGNARPPDAGSVDLARCSSGPGQATVLVPGSDEARAAPQPGRWQLEVVTFDPATFPAAPRRVSGRIDRVAVVFKQPARGGLFDLALQVAPETGYNLDGGTFVPALLSNLDQLLRAKVGVALGQVQTRYLPADAGANVSTLAESRALWTAHAQGTAKARFVNAMMVRSLTFAGGLSGAEPGAPGVYGRPASGVVFEPLASGPQATAVLLAHELLHHFGLAHTSDGYFGPDLVSDTPACANPAGTGCPDERNLLFPYFPTWEPLTVSAGQAKVLGGSPWLYQWVHPGACGGPDVVGLGRAGFAAGSTKGASASLAGACGGAGAEVVHLLRLDAAAKKLEAVATGAGFTPVLYLRRTECGPAGQELACAVGDGGVASVAVDNPAAGAWFVVVDSAAAGGDFGLRVTVTP